MSSALQGLRILNTRPKNQAPALSEEIRQAGGIAVECPLLEIQAMSSDWLDLIPSLTTIQQALFISVNAVHHCFSALRQHNRHWPSSIKVTAIGLSTAKALAQYGVSVHHLPEFFDSEHVLMLDSLHGLKNQNILLVKGVDGRTLIEHTLTLRGANVIPLVVYQRIMPHISAQLIHSLWRDNQVDIILLTSEQSLNHLFKLFGTTAHDWLREKTYLVISERLAKAALSFGIKKIIMSHPHRMIATLLDSNIKD